MKHGRSENLQSSLEYPDYSCFNSISFDYSSKPLCELNSRKRVYKCIGEGNTIILSSSLSFVFRPFEALLTSIIEMSEGELRLEFGRRALEGAML